jgi:hypothetical protein
MRPGQRFGLSEIEKRDGRSIQSSGNLTKRRIGSDSSIGRAFDKPHSCIRSVLFPRGGIPMARLDLIGQVSTQGKDYDAVSSQLAIIERGYLVVFLFTDPKGQEFDGGAARKAMDSQLPDSRF